MTRSLLFALPLALLFTGAATPAPAPLRDAPLRGADCLDPDFARGWSHWDDRTVLVDSGRRKYRIETVGTCWGLDWSTQLRFKSDPVSGRICGGAGEALLTREMRCPIHRVSILSTDDYKALVAEREAERAARKAARKRASN